MELRPCYIKTKEPLFYSKKALETLHDCVVEEKTEKHGLIKIMYNQHYKYIFAFIICMICVGNCISIPCSTISKSCQKFNCCQPLICYENTACIKNSSSFNKN